MSDLMNSERLAEMVRAAADQAKGSLSGDNDLDSSDLYAVADELQRLQAEVVRLRPVVEAMATIGVLTDTPEFMQRNYGPLFFSVAYDLAVMKQQARAALEVEAEHAPGED